MSKEKQKYNFVKLDKEISSQEINSMKDFKNLKANYHKITRPISKIALYRFKNRRYFLAILLIVLVLYLLLFY